MQRADGGTESGSPERVLTKSHLFERSLFYRELLAEREEVLRHKWIESEKQGRDIGYESAWVSWLLHHRAAWWRRRRGACPSV